MIRCKVKLIDTTTTEWGSNYSQKKYHFMPQYDATIPEDIRFSKATPSGDFTILIDNPAAQSYFKTGNYYYFDAVEVPDGGVLAKS